MNGNILRFCYCNSCNQETELKSTVTCVAFCGYLHPLTTILWLCGPPQLVKIQVWPSQ